MSGSIREIFIFACLASITGTVFLVSIIELIFIVHRRRTNHKIEQQVQEMKATFNESLNKLVLEDEAKIEAAEEEAEASTQKASEEKKNLENTYKEQIAKTLEESEKELKSAQEHAHALEIQAKQKADEYVASRTKEVESELMDLVLSVSKKVLPKGISYEAHKELVMQALRDVKIENE